MAEDHPQKPAEAQSEDSAVDKGVADQTSPKSKEYLSKCCSLGCIRGAANDESKANTYRLEGRSPLVSTSILCTSITSGGIGRI